MNLRALAALIEPPQKTPSRSEHTRTNAALIMLNRDARPPRPHAPQNRVTQASHQSELQAFRLRPPLPALTTPLRVLSHRPPCHAELEGEDSEGGDVDWEEEVQKTEAMLRSVLQHKGHTGPLGMPIDGPHPDDEWLVDHLMSRRELGPEEKHLVLQHWHQKIASLPPARDFEYEPSVAGSPALTAKRREEEAGMSQDTTFSDGIGSEELRSLQSPPASQGSVTGKPAS
jgi:hypothetical protein